MVEKDIPKYYLDILKDIEKYIPDIKNIKVNKTDFGLHEIAPEYSVSEELLSDIIESSGPWHSGKPGYLKSIDWTNGKLKEDKNNSIVNVIKIFEKLGASVMCRRPALMTLYPPGGYIGWHHNGDIPGRNILFSWSEKGDGIFRLYNNKLNNWEDYHDSKGWNVKSLKFYSHLEAKETGYSWHAMYTNCYRMSVAFVLTDELYIDRPEIEEMLKYDLKLTNKSLNGAWF